MQFNSQLTPGIFLRRYKRFFNDVRLHDGQVITVHCPNTGSMRSCIEEGQPCLITKSNNKKRKLPFTLEFVHSGKSWVGINTLNANRFVKWILQEKKIDLNFYFEELKSEVKYNNSRIDFMLTGKNGRRFLLEVKSVTMLEQGSYYFPDAITERGRKHVEDLRTAISNGYSAGLLFLIQRTDGSKFRIAKHIDPEYHHSLVQAKQAGLKIFAYQVKLQKARARLILDKKVRVILG